MELAYRISEAELEVMKILWREARPVSFGDIRVELMDTRGWEKSTINTLVARLREKGVIEGRKQNVLHYTPNVTKEEYAEAEEQSMLSKLYEGSAKSFVAALCRRGELTEADIDELKEYFQMGGENK